MLHNVAQLSFPSAVIRFPSAQKIVKRREDQPSLKLAGAQGIRE